MKIKVELDLEDMLEDMACDEQYGITEALRKQILHDCVTQLLPKMQSHIDTKVLAALDTIFTEKVEKAVDRSLQYIMETGKIVKNRHQDPITIHDHMKELFSNNSSWNNPNEQLQKMAKKFAEEMKGRYNTVFATHVVNSMKQQGLLKDDFAKMLTDNHGE